MHFETVIVTPEMARNFLTKNTVNRPLKSTIVKDFADALKRGEWRVSHQGVAFACNGRLLDGQHRLTAISNTGISAPMTIAYDVPEEAFCVMDIGARRTISDIYGTNPYVQAAITWLYKVQTGDSKKTISPQTFDVYYDVFGAAMEKLHASCPRQTPRLSIAVVKAAACLRLYWKEASEDYILSQYANLLNLDFNEMSDTMLALYKMLTAPKKASNLVTFERAYVAFDENNQNRKRIVIRERGCKLGAIREKIGDSVRETEHRRILTNR